MAIYQGGPTIIVTNIGGAINYFGFNANNGWGFYNQATGAFNTGGGAAIGSLTTLLTQFAQSGSGVQMRLFEMMTDGLQHNIQVNEAAPIAGDTNTPYSQNANINVPENFLNNGTTDARAQFGADLLSTAYLGNTILGNSHEKAEGHF